MNTSGKTTCIPMTCEVAASKLSRRFPYNWDLNIYRGCSHGCKYCYALYTHKYLEDGEFYKNIYVKTNIVEQLEKQLHSQSWKREVVNLGGVTDSYQPAEAEYKIMPEILKLLIKYKTPAIISTKSDLILRDYDLIDELSRITYINVAESIVTVDENLRKKIEPGSSSIESRFNVLKEFRKTNASTGLHCMPIIPLLTDSEKNLNELLARAAECNVHYFLPGTLYLRGQTKAVFMNFIETSFPSLFEEFKAIFKTGGADKDYKNNLYNMLLPARSSYGLTGSYSAAIKEKLLKDDPPGQQKLY